MTATKIASNGVGKRNHDAVEAMLNRHGLRVQATHVGGLVSRTVRLNVGTGEEVPIRDLAQVVQGAVYEDAPRRSCAVEWDRSRPNGTPRKLLDCGKLASLGWRGRVRLSQGVRLAYRDFLSR